MAIWEQVTPQVSAERSNRQFQQEKRRRERRNILRYTQLITDYRSSTS